MSHKKIACMALILAVSLFAVPAMADDAATPTPADQNVETGEMTVLADVNFRSPLLVDQEGNRLRVYFRLENNLPQSESGIRYGVQLVKDGKILVDQKVYTDDVLSIEGNSSVEKMFDYTAPGFLKGNFDLWLIAKNGSGLPLATYKLEKPVTIDGNGQFAEILADSAVLSISGDDKKYSLTQGVSLKQGEKLTVTFDVISHLSQETALTPVMTTYYRSAFGDQVGQPQTGNPITLQPGEKKTVSLDMARIQAPQAYDVRIDLLGNLSQLSAPIFFHYVIAGESATIQKLDLDKSVYQKGEMAKATLLWSGSADDFQGSRTGNTANSKIILSLDISGQDGSKCADTVQKELTDKNGKSALDFPIIANCADPQAKVVLKDEQGQVLAEKDFRFEKQEIGTLSGSSSKSQKALIGVLIFLVVLTIVIVVLVKMLKGKKPSMTKALPLILLVLFGMVVGKVDAATIGMSYSWASNSFSINLNKSVYSPGETITATASGSYWESCNNVPSSMTLSSGCGGTLISAGSTSSSLSGAGTCSASSVPGSHSVSFSDYLYGECYFYNCVAIANIASCSTGIWNNDPCAYAGTSTRTCHLESLAPTECNSGRNYASTSASISYTTASATATCSASFSPTNLTSPGTAYLSWNSSNATAVYATCSGPDPLSSTSVGTSYANYPFAFASGASGTETCTFTPYNGATAGTPCSATTRVTAPPTCTASFSPTSLTSPGTAYMSWSSTNATAVYATCSGPVPLPSTSAGTSYTNYPVAFASGDSGTETCTFTPYNGATAGATCSATTRVYTCSGSIPSGSTMCSGDDTNLTASGTWHNAGTTSASCTSAKCEYYTPAVPAASCSASFSPTSLTSPGTANLTWSSSNASYTLGSCTGPLPIASGDYGLNYTNYPFSFSAGQSGSETCTFVPYDSSGKAGTSCSAMVSVSTPSSTPTCTASFSPTSLTSPGTANLTWSSSNASYTLGSCTGPLPIPSGDYGLSYVNYPFAFTAGQSGTEACTFVPYDSSGKAGTSCSGSVAVSASATYSCYGSIPPGRTACPGADTGLTSDRTWYSAGPTSSACTLAGKCAYYGADLLCGNGKIDSGEECDYNSPFSGACSGSPSGNYCSTDCTCTTYNCSGMAPLPPDMMCSNDDIGLTTDIAWHKVGTCSSVKCEYYEPAAAINTCSTPAPPSGTVCPGTKTSNVSMPSEAWSNVSTLANCSASGECQYYTCTPSYSCIAPSCGPTDCSDKTGLCTDIVCGQGVDSSKCAPCSTIHCSCNSGKWQEVQ